MIGIIDYKAGNTASVANALRRLGAEFRITDSKKLLDECTGIIFPGVGHAGSAMQALRDAGLVGWLKETKKPVLGICLGMQLFFESSEEGGTPALEIIPGTLKRFNPDNDKVPHMGWNTFESVSEEHPLMKGISASDYFYYVHSYYAPKNEFTTGVCRYAGTSFAAAVARDNFCGVQFHPEKSGPAGERLLSNFIELAAKPAVEQKK